MVDIETAATAEIKSRIADTDRLSHFINERDKEPVWDGSIFAYKNSVWSNENLIGRAPVQVKGKKSKTITKSTITYPVPVTNLVQYRNEGGVIYFVVYMTEDKKKKIYYASLLPFILNQYIKMANGKKSISISLKSLPERESDFENIVINFVNDRRRQIICKNGKNWSIDEVVDLLGADNVHLNCNFTCIGYDKSDPFSYLKDNEIYLYAENKDGSLSFPIVHVENSEMFAKELDVSISSNGHFYYDKIKVERHRDNHMVIYLDKCIQYIQYYNEKKANLKFQLNGNLDEQITSLSLLLDLIESQSIFVNEIEYPLDITQEEFLRFDFVGAKDKLKYLLLVKELLNELGIDKKLELDKVSEKQEEYIRMLIEAILRGEKIQFKEKGDIQPVGTITIGNLRLMFIFRELNDGTYEIKNFFSHHIDCHLDKEGLYDSSQFSILTDNEYLNISNLNLAIVEKSFKEHENSQHYMRTTNCALEMIKAFDSNNQKIELLKTAERLFDWLIEKNVDNYSNLINLYQCYKRQRSLTDAEIEKLNEILCETDDQMEKAGVQILLDNRRLADLYVNKLREDDKNMFCEFPIYTLYKELK